MSAKEEIGIEIKSNLKETKDQLKQVDAQLAKLNKEKPSIQIRAEKLQNAKSEIAKVNVQLKELAAKKATIKADASNIEDAKKKMADITTQMDKLRMRKATLQVTTENLKGADKDLKDLNTQMRNLSKKQATLSVRAEGLEQAESKLGRIKDALRKMPAVANEGLNFSSAVSNLGSQLDQVSNKMLGFLNPFTSKLNQMIGLGAVFKVIDSGVTMVKNSVGGAVERFDTLRQFPKVLGELGVSAQEAAKSKDMLLEGIDGLPTRLNEISSTAQRMYTSFGSMEKATETANALNNSLLGSGSDAEKAARGTEQYLKVLQSGKMEMDSWNTLSETMDVGLVKIAESFGYVGKSAKKDLYDALSSGTISIDQFNDKMIELGAETESVMGKLARETTKGVATSTKNLQTAVVNGLEGLMGKADEATKKLTGKDIAENIASLKPLIGKTFTAIGGQMDKLFVYLDQNKDKIGAFFKNAKDTIKESVGKIDFGAFFSGLKDAGAMIVGTFKALFAASQPAIKAGKMLLETLGGGSVEKGLARAIGLYASFAISAKALAGPLKVLGKLTNIKMPSFFGGKGGGVDATTFEAFKGNMFDGLMSLGKKAGNLALILGAIKLVEAAAEAMKQIDEKVPNDFSSLISKIGAMTLAIGAMGGLAFVASKIPKIDMFSGLAMIALISVDLMIAAEALQQINEKVPGSFGDIVPKLKNMGIALVGMGALVTAAGVLATLSPITAVAGLIAVSALSAELMLTAEALQQINEKVPDDMKNIGAKIISISLAIGGMGALATAVGAFMATGIGAVAVGAGLVTIAAISHDLIKVANAIKQVDENVPSDVRSIRKKIGSIVDVIQYMTNADLGGVIDAFSNMFKGFNVSAVSGVLKKMATLVEDFSSFPSIDATRALDSIEQVKKVIDSLSDGEGFIKKIQKLAGTFVDTKQVDQVKKYVTSLKSISSSLKGIDADKVDYKTVKQRLSEIMSAVEVLTDSKFNARLANVGDPKHFESVKKIIGSLKDIMKDINSLSGNIEIAPIKTNIALIKEVITSLGNKELFSGYSMAKNQGSKPFASMVKTIGYMVEIAQKINQLSGNIDIGPVKANIELIKDVIRSLDNQDLFKNYGMGKNEGSKPFGSIVKTIGYLVQIAQKLNELSSNIEIGAAKANIEIIKDVIKSMNMNEIFANYGMGKNEGSKPFASIVKTMNHLVTIAQKLNELSMNINYESARTNIDLIKDAIAKISENSFKEQFANMLKLDQWKAILDRLSQIVSIGHKINEFNFEINSESLTKVIAEIKKVIFLLADPTIKDAYSKMMKPEDWNVVITSINALIQLKNKIKEIANNPISSEAISGEIQKVKSLIQEIADFPSYQGVESLYELVNAFSRLIDTLTGMTGKFTPIGKGYGQQIVNGFKSVDIPKKFVTVINNAITKLKAKTSSFTPIGKAYGEALNNGFGQGIANMANKIDSQISNLNSKARQFSGLGNSFGMLLANSFEAQIQNLSNSTSKQIEVIQLSLNNLRMPNLTPNRGSSGSLGGLPSVTAATGGYINMNGVSYLSDGGQPLFKPKGTDIVPAMLTPGEYVHNTDAVKTFGLDFMQRVNNLDLKGAYQAFTNRFANKLAMQPIMNTVNNNTYNNQTTNNNPRVNQYMSGSDAGHGLGRAKRYLKRLK